MKHTIITSTLSLLIGLSTSHASVTAFHAGTGGNGANGIGFEGNAPGDAQGQTFTATLTGDLTNFSFGIYQRQEAIDKSENLIVQLWNTLPNGNVSGAETPLLTVNVAPNTHGLLGTSKSIVTVNTPGSGINLIAGEKYAMTFSVANDATTQFSGMYGLDFDNDGYAGGTRMSRYAFGGDFFASSGDMNTFTVSVVPEPSSTALLGLGGLALLLRRRR